MGFCINGVAVAVDSSVHCKSWHLPVQSHSLFQLLPTKPLTMTPSTTSNGLQEANQLIQAIHHQITCADAPITNLSDIQSLLRNGTHSGDKSKSASEAHDNLSSTASELSFNSSIGPSHFKKPPLLPPRPPRENIPVNHLEDAAAVLTGTVSLANLCRRTEESIKGIQNGEQGSFFPVLAPLVGEIRPFDPTPRRSNGGSSVRSLHVPQPEGHGKEQIHTNDTDPSENDYDENVTDFAQYKQQQRHKQSTPNRNSHDPTQKPRMQMFASEYARIVSSSNYNHTTMHSRSRLPPNMMSSKLKAKLSKSDHDPTLGGIATLEGCPASVSSAAITDLLISSDAPPRGYYRLFFPRRNDEPYSKT